MNAWQHSPLDAFAARAAYRARLWHAGGIDLHTSVDDLEADARRFRLDVDEAQAVMAAAFAPFRKKPMTTKNVFDFPEDDGTPRLVDPQPERDGREREDAEAAGGKARMRKRASHSMISMPTCWADISSHRRAIFGQALRSTAGCGRQSRSCRPAHGWIETSRSSK